MDRYFLFLDLPPVTKKDRMKRSSFLVPWGDENPPWRFIYLHFVAFNVIY
jgi:hypothetical protein